MEIASYLPHVHESGTNLLLATKQTSAFLNVELFLQAILQLKACQQNNLAVASISLVFITLIWGLRYNLRSQPFLALNYSAAPSGLI